MTVRSALSVLQHLHGLAREQQADKLSDRECLERFQTQRDEDAFAVLVVRGVCRRMLSPPLRPNDTAQQRRSRRATVNCQKPASRPPSAAASGSATTC